jgi:hypothetical protein
METNEKSTQHREYVAPELIEASVDATAAGSFNDTYEGGIFRQAS